MTIPDKFLWGGSISAAQCEGGWDEGGKSPVQVDFEILVQQQIDVGSII